MQFVENFKQARTEEGHSKMYLVGCLKEGKKYVYLITKILTHFAINTKIMKHNKSKNPK